MLLNQYEGRTHGKGGEERETIEREYRLYRNLRSLGKSSQDNIRCVADGIHETRQTIVNLLRYLFSNHRRIERNAFYLVRR